MTRAAVLLHGATGFTGKLTARALQRRGVPFAVGGRSRARVEALARELGGVEAVVVDLGRAESIRDALEGRRLVAACVGPFIELGEPMLASAARAGVHYVDTTGEQPFVHLAVTRYRATAEASGACVVPAMAYEIAPADWGAHRAAEELGGAPDRLDVVYMLRPTRGTGTSRGTKLSLLRMIADTDPLQYVGGALVPEEPARRVARFRAPGGRAVPAVSFPSPEAIVVPGHTGARQVVSYMAVGEGTARALHAARRALPRVVGLARGALGRAVTRAPEGPEGEAREATFDIVIEAGRGDARVRVVVSGRDPYGLTAEIQALAAERAVRGELRARGVVAPSDAIPPEEALAALAPFGLSLRIERD